MKIIETELYLAKSATAGVKDGVSEAGEVSEVVFTPALSDVKAESAAPEFSACNGVGLCLGFFDGVHQGHRELLRTLIYECGKHGYSPDVWTFDTLPKFKRPGIVTGLLQTKEQRLHDLASIGVARTFIQKFTPALADLSGEDFLTKVVLPNLPVKLIVVGYDFRFGHNMAWGVEELANFSREHNIELRVVPPVTIGTETVHSAKIRTAIAAGDLRLATKLSGRHFSLAGRVIKGNAIGRELGFATANILVDESRVLPPHGVYRSLTRVNGRAYRSISFLGIRPTVNEKQKHLQLETHIFDAAIDLYGSEINVELWEFMQPEKSFADLASLKSAIKQYCATAIKPNKVMEEMYLSMTVGNINVYYLPTDRFVLSRARIMFSLPLKPESAAVSVALSYLTSVTAAYPEENLLNKHLKNLYNASIYADGQKAGDIQETMIRVNALHQTPDGSKPFAEALDLALQCLLRPALNEKGEWRQDVFDRVKQNALDEWAAQQAYKPTAAWCKTLRLAFPDSVYSMSSIGDIEYLRQLSIADVERAYRETLSRAKVDIYILGRPDADLEAVLTERLPELAKFFTNPIVEIVPGRRPHPTSINGCGSFTDNGQLEQSRLNVLLDTKIPYTSIKLISLALLNYVIGGDSSSLIFDLVREKHGLAYEIYTSILPFRSVLAVCAGIHPGEEIKTKTLLREALQEWKEKGLPEKAVARAKKMMQNEKLLLQDRPAALLEYYIRQLQSGWNLRPETYSEIVKAVTLPELQALAAQLEWKVDYSLQPTTDNKNFQEEMWGKIK